MFRCFPKPTRRFAQLLGNSMAGKKTETEVALSDWIILLSRAAKPLHRLRIILHHALTVLVRDTQIGLCLRIAFFGGLAHLIKGLPGFA